MAILYFFLNEQDFNSVWFEVTSSRTNILMYLHNYRTLSTDLNLHVSSDVLKMFPPNSKIAKLLFTAWILFFKQGFSSLHIKILGWNFDMQLKIHLKLKFSKILKFHSNISFTRVALFYIGSGVDYIVNVNIVLDLYANLKSHRIQQQTGQNQNLGKLWCDPTQRMEIMVNLLNLADKKSNIIPITFLVKFIQSVFFFSCPEWRIEMEYAYSKNDYQGRLNFVVKYIYCWFEFNKRIFVHMHSAVSRSSLVPLEVWCIKQTHRFDFIQTWWPNALFFTFYYYEMHIVNALAVFSVFPPFFLSWRRIRGIWCLVYVILWKWYIFQK